MTLEQHCLLREVKQLITDSKADGKHAKAKTDTNQSQPVLLTQQVCDFLKSHYDFRYNLLTNRSQCRYLPAISQ